MNEPKHTEATLVERLRSCHCGPSADAQGHRIGCLERREAADEIEHLRAIKARAIEVTREHRVGLEGCIAAEYIWKGKADGY